MASRLTFNGYALVTPALVQSVLMAAPRPIRRRILPDQPGVLDQLFEYL